MHAVILVYRKALQRVIRIITKINDLSCCGYYRSRLEDTVLLRVEQTAAYRKCSIDVALLEIGDHGIVTVVAYVRYLHILNAELFDYLRNIVFNKTCDCTV